MGNEKQCSREIVIWYRDMLTLVHGSGSIPEVSGIFLNFLREELKMNEVKECKHKSPIYVVKRIRLLDYLVSKNLFPNAIQPDATNPHYKNWIYKNTPELEAALAAYEPFKRAQR